MALRRAAALVPRLLQQAQVTLPASSVLPTQFEKLVAVQPAPTNPFEIFRDSWRRYATDAVATASESKLSPTEKLTVTPSYKIQYDEYNHSRYPPSVNQRNFSYFVLTGSRFLYASAIRLAVLKFIVSMSAAADVLALSSLEVDLANIEEGQTVVVKWRGKPVFIRHRTDDEVADANAAPISELRDAQTDAARVVNPKYLIVVGICTHLGCVPISGAGDYNGWFCPCHGSHYDISGRIRKGPAPYNLEVPEYKFLSDQKVIIG